MIKRYLGVLALACVLAGGLRAQNTTTFGNIVSQGTPCGASNCVYYQLPPGTQWVVTTVTGTWTGTLETATTTAPNANYTNLSTIAWTALATATSNGTWSVATIGATYLRVRATSWSGGLAHVAMAADSSLGAPVNPIFPGTMTATGLQAPAGGSNGNCWFTDGTNGPCGTASNPAGPALAVNFSNAAVNGFQGHQNMTVDPTLFSLNSAITNGTYATAKYATGSSTGGIKEAYNACVAATVWLACDVEQSADITIPSPQTITLSATVPLILHSEGHAIRCTNGVGTDCLTWTAVSYGGTGGFKWDNFRIIGTGSSGNGIVIEHMLRPNIQGSIWNFAAATALALRLNDIENGDINVLLQSDTNSLRLENSVNENNIIDRTDFGGNGVALYIGSGSSKNQISGLIQSTTGTKTVVLDGTSLNIANNAFSVWFENDGDGTPASRLINFNTAAGAGNTGLVINTEFNNSYFTAGSNGALGSIFTSTYPFSVSGVTMIHNYDSGYATFADSTFTGYQPFVGINENDTITGSQSFYSVNQNPNQDQTVHANILAATSPSLPSTFASGVVAQGSIQSPSHFDQKSGVLGQFGNLLAYSQFDSASLGTTWTQPCGGTNPFTLTANTTDFVDPLNGLNVTLKAVTGAALGCANHFTELDQSITWTSGATYTISAWMRGAIGGEHVTFGGAAGTVQSTAVVLTTSWQRYSFTFVSPSSGASPAFFAGLSTSSTYYLYQAQLEQTSAPGYPIHTIASAQALTYGVDAVSVIDSALTPGASPICPNGTNGAFVNSACGAAGGTVTVGSGTMAANTCSTPTTATDTGLATSGAGSRVVVSYTGNPTTLVGWGSTGGMVFQAWGTAANTVAWQICNQTISSINYSAITFSLGAN